MFDPIAKIFLPNYSLNAQTIFVDFPCDFVCKCERHSVGDRIVTKWRSLL